MRLVVASTLVTGYDVHTCNPILEAEAGGLSGGEAGYQASQGCISRPNKKYIYFILYYVIIKSKFRKFIKLTSQSIF